MLRLVFNCVFHEKSVLIAYFNRGYNFLQEKTKK